MTESSDEKQKFTLRMVRDATFGRFAVDDFYSIDLGRDVEVCCAVNSPQIANVTKHGEDAVELSFDPVQTEVARLRAPLASWIQLSMSILEDGIKSGKVSSDQIVRGVQRMIEARDQKASQNASE